MLTDLQSQLIFLSMKMNNVDTTCLHHLAINIRTQLCLSDVNIFQQPIRNTTFN